MLNMGCRHYIDVQLWYISMVYLLQLLSNENQVLNINNGLYSQVTEIIKMLHKHIHPVYVYYVMKYEEYSGLSSECVVAIS